MIWNPGGGNGAAQAVRLQSLASVATRRPSPHEHLPRQVRRALPEILIHSLYALPWYLILHFCASILMRRVLTCCIFRLMPLCQHVDAQGPNMQHL